MTDGLDNPTKARRFVGKTVVITGSTAGIGFSIAERLGYEGANIVISSRKQEAVDSALATLRRQGIECVGRICHVGIAEQREALIRFAVKKFGKIDALVSNAVVNPVAGPLLDMPDAALDKILDVNIKAAILLTKLAVPHMTRGSSILYVTSIAAYDLRPPLSMYAVTKTALLGVVKALSQELGPGGIRVNGIAPGVVPTKFSEALVKTAEARAQSEARTTLQRLGTPEEIAAPASFLLSDDASYVTGETLVVAGGMQSRL